jgi:CheY-like chemotaxis protein
MRFFIVDDSKSAISLIRDPLLELGHEVESETDSTQALERIRWSRPDCIILDIMMPGIDGLTLCKQIRDEPELRSMRIIMVSAKAYEHDRKRAMELGASGFINKLSEKDHLIDRVLEIAESRFTLKFWGVRGTLPVPGKDSVRYGGNTNCVTLELPTKTLFIFDGGGAHLHFPPALGSHQRAAVLRAAVPEGQPLRDPRLFARRDEHGEDALGADGWRVFPRDDAGVRGGRALPRPDRGPLHR